MPTRQTIKRGILQSFNASTYTATVLIIEATSYVLSNVPIATSMDGTSAIVGASCAVLFFDESNYTDAVVLAVYGTVPDPTPGRVVLVAGETQVNAQVINSGSTRTFTMGGSIPDEALGVLCKIKFTSTSSPAHIDLAAHGGNLGLTVTIGDNVDPSHKIQAEALVPLDSNGQMDIKANGADCTVTLSTYGYLI